VPDRGRVGQRRAAELPDLEGCLHHGGERIRVPGRAVKRGGGSSRSAAAPRRPRRRARRG
jgi:hypothetical protein